MTQGSQGNPLMRKRLIEAKQQCLAEFEQVTPNICLLADKATTEGLASEDWGLNMEICDIINETEEG